MIVLSAPSGAGKTTLCQKLLNDFPRLQLSISSTTRSPRGQERHGQEYFFLEKSEFEAAIAAGEFAEWARVHDHYYGTSKKAVDAAFSQGKSLLLDIDVQGAASLKNAYPKDAYLVFISPPDLATLEARLKARGTESGDAIEKRMKNARAEMEKIDEFDAVIVNDDLERAYRKLHALIAAALGA